MKSPERSAREISLTASRFFSGERNRASTKRPPIRRRSNGHGRDRPPDRSGSTCDLRSARTGWNVAWPCRAVCEPPLPLDQWQVARSWSSSRIRSNANSTASWPRRRLRSAPGAARRRCYATAIRRFAAALNAASPSPGGGGGGGGAAGLISGSAWGFCRPAAALRPAIIRSACSASNSVM